MSQAIYSCSHNLILIIPNYSSISSNAIMFTEGLLFCRQGANPFRCVTSFKEQNLSREVSSQNIDKEMNQQSKTPANQASGGHSGLSGLDLQIISRATTHLQSFKATKAAGFFFLFCFVFLITTASRSCL